MPELQWQGNDFAGDCPLRCCLTK